jgi:hypothetical protein
MTTPADDFAAERAFEALLAGRGVPEEAAGLAAFTGAVRASATQPGRPNAALAELLATGLLTDQSSPSIRTAVAAEPPPSRRARVRRRRFAMIFPALLAKFLSASALAQAATGATVVVVAVTGAGATGVLGEDVQDGLATVVGADEPGNEVTATATATGDLDPTTDPGAVPATVETTAPVTPELTPEEWIENGPIEGQKFSDWLHLAYPSGKVDGQIVSKFAREKHLSAEELQELEDIEGLEDIEDADDDATATPTATPEVATADAGEPTHGKGNGGGKGKGGSNGNSGHEKN